MIKMEKTEKQELIKVLIEKEKEIGNDLTKEEISEDLDECLESVGEESFNKILNLDWQRRDNVLRVLQLLSKD